MYDEIDEQAIRKKVEKRLDARREFNIHAAVFIVANVGVWLFWAALPGVVASVPGIEAEIAEFANITTTVPWPIFVTFGWGIGIVAHFLTYYYKHGAGARRREETIAREVQREMERRGLTKRKHNDRLMLTDDGEISGELSGEISGDYYVDDAYSEDLYETDYDSQTG